MRLKAMFLAAMTVSVVALAVVSAGYAISPAPRRVAAPAIGKAAPARSGGVRVRCNRPGTLRLIRFEDGSARLNCGRHLLVRVSVPG